MDSLDKFFEVSTSLKIDDHDYQIFETLACEHSVYRHEGDNFEKHDVWRESRGNVYLELSNGEVLIVLLPIVCGDNGIIRRVYDDYVPSIILLSKDKNEFEFYISPVFNENENLRVKVSHFSINQSKARKVSHDYKYDNFAWNYGNVGSMEYYSSFSLYIYPKKIWRRDKILSELLHGAKKSFFLDENLSSRVGKLLLVSDWSEWGLGTGGTNLTPDYRLYYAYPVFTSIEKKNSFKANLEKRGLQIYKKYGKKRTAIPTSRGSKINKVEIEYKSYRLTYFGQHIFYDADTEDLVFVARSTLKR